MPTKLRIIVGALIGVLIAVGAYLLLTGNKEMSKTSTLATPHASFNSSQNMPESKESGQYLPYSAEAVAKSKGQRILFFYASWCPQCRQLETSIKAGEIPDGVTIFKVDYDSNQKLRQQYAVTIQTTLVLLDEKGNEMKKYVAYDKPSLDAIVKNLL